MGILFSKSIEITTVLVIVLYSSFNLLFTWIINAMVLVSILFMFPFYWMNSVVKKLVIGLKNGR
jgi:hypothetical protein